MSAANIIVLADRVHLVTDDLNSHKGAPYSFGHKVMPMPHVGVAVAVRGNRSAMGIVWELLSGTAQSFDPLRDHIVDIVRPVFDAQRAILAKHFGALPSHPSTAEQTRENKPSHSQERPGQHSQTSNKGTLQATSHSFFGGRH